MLSIEEPRHAEELLIADTVSTEAGPFSVEDDHSGAAAADLAAPDKVFRWDSPANEDTVAATEALAAPDHDVTGFKPVTSVVLAAADDSDEMESNPSEEKVVLVATGSPDNKVADSLALFMAPPCL